MCNSSTDDPHKDISGSLGKVRAKKGRENQICSRLMVIHKKIVVRQCCKEEVFRIREAQDANISYSYVLGIA